jgi:hypothetical protein
MLTKETDTYRSKLFFSRLKIFGRVFFGGVFFLLFFFAFLVDLSSADDINGFLEFTYDNFNSESEGISGETTKTTGNSFKQKYNLRLDKTIFPNLRLDAGGLYEKIETSSEINDTETDITETRLNPFVNLILNTPLYSVGAYYNWREDKQKISDLPSLPPLINENYRTILKWEPEDFPSMKLRFEKKESFDKERSFRDLAEDFISLDLRYDSIKGLDISYQPRYRKRSDLLEGLEVTDVVQEGRVDYSGKFFEKRVSLYTSYRISQVETETHSQGTGEVSIEIIPLSGLSAIDDTPTEGALDPNPALIDGNLAASAGINIGLPPLGGNTQPRNMGLEFVNQTEVSTLFLWVDRELPNDIANSFSWEIYVSDDNENWNLLQTVSPAPFGTFLNRFEIQFSNSTTRFIKVVTLPLQLGVPGASGFPDIFVTEVQAFIRRPLEGGREKFTRTSQTYELDTRIKILNTPSLFYDLSYFLAKQDPTGSTRYTLSNGFSLSHRFSRPFSGRASFFREDNKEEENSVLYRYDASVTATPLKTLSHTLTFSGRRDETGEDPGTSNSIFLRNTAELYKGVSINFAGGLTLDERNSGEENESTMLSLSAAIVPNPNLTMNVDLSDTDTKQSGSDEPDASTSEQRAVIGLSCTPFKTLLLSGSVEVLQSDDRERTFQNFGVNWAPFPDGDLQFFFLYSESLRPEDDQKTRAIINGLGWEISRHFKLDLAYNITKSKASSQKTDANNLNAILRVTF